MGIPTNLCPLGTESFNYTEVPEFVEPTPVEASRKPVETEDLLDPRVPLSNKQRKLVKAMIEQPTLAKAAMRAGYSAAHAGQLMKQPKMLTALQSAMEKAGVTDDLLASRIREGLDAYRQPGRDGLQHPDFAVRKQYLEQVMKVRGDLKDGAEVTHRHIVVNVTPELIRGLLDARAIDQDDVQELILGSDGAFAPLEA